MNKEQPEIEVCFGPECGDKGGPELAKELRALGHTIVMGDCRSQCANAPLVLVENQGVVTATCAKVLAKIEQVQGCGA
ncbi:MAG: (2Fe-2S) ferredoxin domain-containing protein [Ghiorsea sp.]|nr:(2Fe-2S) ferredoxin domain-containing protein [Ghiorsea sp.]MDQ6981218.1 (2Fe-2S) ferredoxin domain-containing protein [Ghiorsea sp.]MDQ7057684.1 (2Fe-2S) ferredoxin domain-containing protein [Ghiorsea sp.]